jgi:GLPGLI family protein
MRKLVFAFGLICIITEIFAQQTNGGFLLSGEVIYSETVKMDIQLEGVDEQLAAQLPSERKTEKILRFTENEAIFENHRTDDPEEALPVDEGSVMIKMQEPENLTYVDLANHKVIEQKEFLSRVFLIESELVPDRWKMTGQQRKILDYACQEAITMKDGAEVHAWFTPQIQVEAGPGVFSGLPGMVLAVEMFGGDRKLEAISIELRPLEKNEINKPAKGRKVTREEYQAIVSEKLKEMGMEGDGTWHGDGGAGTSTVVIRIQQ